jgi:Family of unknown function (DUF6339)
MKLTFISEGTLRDLKINNKAFLKHYYKKDEEWFTKYFNNQGKTLTSKIEFEMPELSYHEDYSISDRENVKAVYSALKHMPVLYATQERLWAGLAHLQFRDYTFYRLNKDLNDKNEKRIETSLFFKRGKKRSLYVNIISRLWWVGYMTYDETNKDNPFWLTDFFTESDFSARCIVFFSSNFTSNREITVGILKSLYKLKINGITIKRDHFVQANKYLNVLGGAMILDMLNAIEVENLVYKHLCKIFNILEEEVA